MKRTYFIRHHPGPAWKKGKGIAEQNLLAHGEYMHSLYKQGILLEGGPFLDATGGLAIIQVEDETQADQIANEDPAVVEGVFTAELRPWMRVNWDSYGD